jgi:hypothetical protein
MFGKIEQFGLETERFFAERAKQADMEELRAILFRPVGGLREPETIYNKCQALPQDFPDGLQSGTP